MLRTLLVGLDQSPRESAAVELGIRWAKRFDAMLVGMGVVDAASLRGPAVGTKGGYLEKLQNQWVGDAQHEMDRLLQQFAVRCSEAQVACKLLEETGLPWEQIALESQRFDMILLGHGTHFTAQPDSHRTLSNLLRHTCRPVVMAPAQPPPDGPIIVAYDGSLQAARALQMFTLLGLAKLGEVHVLTIDPLDHVAAARIADRAMQYLSRHSVLAQPLPLVETTPAARVILQHATRLRAGLIVMGAYGRSRFEEFFLGSATQTLLKESSVPIFLHP